LDHTSQTSHSSKSMSSCSSNWRKHLWTAPLSSACSPRIPGAWRRSPAGAVIPLHGASSASEGLHRRRPTWEQQLPHQTSTLWARMARTGTVLPGRSAKELENTEPMVVIVPARSLIPETAVLSHLPLCHLCDVSGLKAPIPEPTSPTCLAHRHLIVTLVLASASWYLRGS
jgi:hypothetical protein